jgi:hypothetical protein
VNASSLGGVSASNIFSRISTNNLGPFSYNAGTRAWAFRRDDWPDNGVSSAAGVALLNDGTGEPRAALWSSHDLGSGADANHGRLQLYGKCNLIGYSNWNCGSIEARNLRANVGDQGSDQRIWVLRPRGAEGLENPDCGGRMDILTRSPGGEFFLGIHQNEYGCLGLGPNIGYPWPNPGDISALVCISPGEAARGRAPMKFLRQVRSPDLEKTAQLLNQPEEGAVEFDGQFSITKENNIRMGLGGTLFREAVHREAQAGGTLPIKATTISSNTLSRNNNEIVINAAGMVLSTDPSNHLLLRFGHSVIFDSEAQLATPGISKWFLEARIVRRSNGSEVVTTHLSLRGGNDSRDLTLITEDCSANNPLELLAQGSVTLDLWEGEWKP